VLVAARSIFEGPYLMSAHPPALQLPVCKSPREGLAHTGNRMARLVRAHEICTPQVGSPALIPRADKSPAAQTTTSFTSAHRSCDGRDSRSLTTYV
jgi:hypothetical protein